MEIATRDPSIKDSQAEATAEAHSATARLLQRRAMARQENVAAWYAHHRNMHALHTQLAQEHEAKALSLLERRSV